MPGFRRWLTQQLAEESNPDAALLPKLARDGWWHDPEQSEPLRAALMRLCATYLTRRQSPGNRIDPVARFHLGNGARLERINWLGNTEFRAIQESFGIMVNYLYDRDTIEDNHEAFVRGTIVRSQEVDAILKGVGVDEVDTRPNSVKRRERPISPPRHLTPFGCIRAVRNNLPPYDEKG